LLKSFRGGPARSGATLGIRFPERGRVGRAQLTAIAVFRGDRFDVRVRLSKASAICSSVHDGPDTSAFNNICARRTFWLDPLRFLMISRSVPRSFAGSFPNSPI
jgi:hypothetical protein